jgi:hypothetical protein
MKADIFWLQEERLSEALIQSVQLPETRLVYIFDEVWLQSRPPSLKRLQFIYEVLLALPSDVDIYRGDPEVILATLARKTPDHQIRTFAPRDLELRARVQALSESLGAEILTPTPWVPEQSQTYGRFFKYYNAVKKQAIAAARDHNG